MLTALGLTDSEEAVYRTLVAAPDLTLRELTSSARCTAEAATVILERLVAMGLAVKAGSEAGQEAAEGGAVKEAEAGGPRFRATPPLLGLAPMLATRREQLVQAEAAMNRLAETFRLTQPDRPGSPVEVVTGAEAVRQRFAQVQLAARTEILGLMPVQTGTPIVPVEDNPSETDAMRRGVQIRVVLERAWFDRPDTAGLIETAITAGQQLHVVDDLPLQMAIADRRIAMLPLGPGGPGAEPSAAIIHEPGLVAAFVALFEACRERGWQLTGGGRDADQAAAAGASDTDTGGADASAAAGPGPDEPDDVDRAILGLLHAGLTDVNIARQVGLGPRSVQRRLQRLMRLASANSRFQLGCHAVRAGWLPTDRG